MRPEAADRGGRPRLCSQWDELSLDSFAASDQLQRTRHVVKGNALGGRRRRRRAGLPPAPPTARCKVCCNDCEPLIVSSRAKMSYGDTAASDVRSGDPEYMESACTPNGGQAGLEPADRARCLDDDVPALRLVEFGDVRAPSARPRNPMRVASGPRLAQPRRPMPPQR